MRANLAIVAVLCVSGGWAYSAAAGDLSALFDKKAADEAKAKRDAEKAEQRPITREELCGRWRYYPGLVQSGIWLREDGSMTWFGGIRTNAEWPGAWEYYPEKQQLVFATKQTRRCYRAKIEGGKIVLVEGRELFRQTVDMDRPLPSPENKMISDPMLRVPVEKDKAGTKG